MRHWKSAHSNLIRTLNNTSTSTSQHPTILLLLSKHPFPSSTLLIGNRLKVSQVPGLHALHRGSSLSPSTLYLSTGSFSFPDFSSLRFFSAICSFSSCCPRRVPVTSLPRLTYLPSNRRVCVCRALLSPPSSSPISNHTSPFFCLISPSSSPSLLTYLFSIYFFFHLHLTFASF